MQRRGRLLVSGRTVHANINCYRTVSSHIRMVFGLDVLTKHRGSTLEVKPRRVPLSLRDCIACPLTY